MWCAPTYQPMYLPIDYKKGAHMSGINSGQQLQDILTKRRQER